ASEGSSHGGLGGTRRAFRVLNAWRRRKDHHHFGATFRCLCPRAQRLAASEGSSLPTTPGGRLTPKVLNAWRRRKDHHQVYYLQPFCDTACSTPGGVGRIITNWVMTYLAHQTVLNAWRRRKDHHVAAPGNPNPARRVLNAWRRRKDHHRGRFLIRTCGASAQRLAASEGSSPDNESPQTPRS